MWKEKVTRIFSANNVSIEKIEKKKSLSFPVADGYLFAETKSLGASPGKTKTIEKEVRMQSPLGFYYTKKVKETVSLDTGEKIDSSKLWYIVRFNHKGTIHRLKFLIGCGENSVRKNEDSLRPWEISPGDNALNDNMIKALITKVDEFFDDIDRYKIVLGKYVQDPILHEWKWVPDPRGSISEVKNETYEYLFGNKNGLRVITDEQKIVSHGFDLKTSFRKDKEKK